MMIHHMKRINTVLLIAILFIAGLYYLYDETLVNEGERQNIVFVNDTLKNVATPRRVDFKFAKPDTVRPPVLIDTFFYLIDYAPGDTLNGIVTVP